MDLNTDKTVTMAIPQLGDASTSPAFSMFRAEESFSFVRAYDAKSVNVPEYRHSVIRYRNVDKPGTVQKAAQMVTIPQVKFSEDIAIVLSEKEMQVFRGVIEDAEDLIVRGLIEKGASKIAWADLGWTKALDFLTAERVSSRLTREQIENWTLVAMKAFCEQRAMQVCEAKAITDPAEVNKQKAGTLNAYVQRMMKLAAPVPNLGQNEATALHNALLTAKLDDDMAKVLKAKLHAILHPEIVECGDL